MAEEPLSLLYQPCKLSCPCMPDVVFYCLPYDLHLTIDFELDVYSGVASGM